MENVMKRAYTDFAKTETIVIYFMLANLPFYYDIIHINNIS